MKKALVLLLALCMLLTLCACAGSGEKEFEAAKALYDAGDYENAIEALQSLDHTAEIESMIADAQKQLAAESYGFLYTTWINVADDGSPVVFFDNGTCKIHEYATQYTVENGKITMAGSVEMTITQEGGVYRLAGDGVDLVREEDYDQFIAEHTVELTLDNYLDYFEWVEERVEGKDANGNISLVSIEHKLKPKKGYEGRVNIYLSQVEGESAYVENYYSGENFTVNFETLECSGVSYSRTEPQNGFYALDVETSLYICNDFYYTDCAYINSDMEITSMEGHLVIR